MFTVYSKDNCPFCVRAISLLTLKGLDFEVLKLNEDFTREELLEKFPNARSFPQITNEGDHVGGYDDLYKLLENHG